MADDLNYLQTKAREWASKVVNLYHTPAPSDMQAQKTALMNTAKSIKDTVEAITGPLTFLEPMNQLGFIPVIIGVAGVAGAVAMIVKWTLDYQTFIKKVEDRNALIKGGLSPQQAANVTNMSEKQGTTLFGFDLKQLVWPAMIIGGGYLYGKKQRWF